MKFLWAAKIEKIGVLKSFGGNCNETLHATSVQCRAE